MSAHDLEDRLRDRLAVLAEKGAGPHPVAAALEGDLDRGHRARRRRTVLRTGLAAVAVAAVVGTVGVLAPGGDVTRSETPAATGESASPSPSPYCVARPRPRPRTRPRRPPRGTRGSPRG